MKKHIAIKNQPIKLPFLSTAFYTFLMHYFQAPGWAWGVFITLFAILWIIAIVLLWNQEKIDLFEPEATRNKVSTELGSNFKQRLAEMEAQAKAQKDG